MWAVTIYPLIQYGDLLEAYSVDVVVMSFFLDVLLGAFLSQQLVSIGVWRCTILFDQLFNIWLLQPISLIICSVYFSFIRSSALLVHSIAIMVMPLAVVSLSRYGWGYVWGYVLITQFGTFSLSIQQFDQSGEGSLSLSSVAA